MASRFTFPIARISGIPVRVHWLLPAAMAYEVFSTPGYTRGEVLLVLFVFYIVMLASVLLHELGHALAGRHHGLRVLDIMLWPLGGLCSLGDRPRTPRQQIQVSLAGIAVSVALGLAAGGAMWIRDGAPPGLPLLAGSRDILLTTWNLNLAVALFNMLPGIPFDGGGVLEAVLWRRFGRPRARLVVLVSGAIVGAGLVYWGVAYDNVYYCIMGGWGLSVVAGLYMALRETGLEEDNLLGVYDFSQGNTSLEASAPPLSREERRRERVEEALRAEEKRRREEEKRSAVAVKDAVSREARLDRLLDRIAAEGISSLSPEDRAFLDEESRRLRGRRPGRP